jgi:hypothetical protein
MLERRSPVDFQNCKQTLLDVMMRKSAMHVPRALRTEFGIEFIKPRDKCGCCSHKEECQLWLDASEMFACNYEPAASKR